MSLTIIVKGTGRGSVHLDDPVLECSEGTCKTSVGQVRLAHLRATAKPDSRLVWGPACPMPPAPSGGLISSDCTVEMEGDRTVTVNFDLAPPSTPADACMQARRAILQDVSNLVTRYASVCSVDVECIVVETSLPCQELCSTGILTEHRSTFKQDLAQYASRICPALPVNCGIAPECAPLVGARCMNGICRPVPAGMGL